jgi:hypothetical protein
MKDYFVRSFLAIRKRYFWNVCSLRLLVRRSLGMGKDVMLQVSILPPLQRFGDFHLMVRVLDWPNSSQDRFGSSTTVDSFFRSIPSPKILMPRSLVSQAGPMAMRRVLPDDATYLKRSLMFWITMRSLVEFGLRRWHSEGVLCAIFGKLRHLLFFNDCRHANGSA